MLFLPKFKVEETLDLKSIFGEDFKTLFSSEFPKIADQWLELSVFKQKACIEVNEQGTEAAAATYAEIRADSLGERPPTIHFDRPFYFYIVDEVEKIVLFEGKVNNPLK